MASDLSGIVDCKAVAAGPAEGAQIYHGASRIEEGSEDRGICVGRPGDLPQVIDGIPIALVPTQRSQVALASARIQKRPGCVSAREVGKAGDLPGIVDPVALAVGSPECP